jgi:hypothetical protein
VDVSTALATLYVRTQLLGARKDQQGNVELPADAIEALVAAAVAALTSPAQAARVHTLQLQSDVAQAQEAQTARGRTEKVQQRAKSLRLLQEVTGKRSAGDAFNAMVLYLMHESRVPSLLDEAVQRDVALTLETIFPRALMDAFIAQPDSEKARQLEEVARIVWGVRLFAMATGRGPTAGMVDTLSATRELVAAVSHATSALDHAVSEQVTDYLAVLSCPSLVLEPAVRERVHDEHVDRLQLQLYARSLAATLGELLQRVDDVAAQWTAAVNEAVQLQAAGDGSGQDVPKSVIYPKFMALADLWERVLGLHGEAQDVERMLQLVQRGFDLPNGTSALRPSDVVVAQQSLAGTCRTAPNRAALTTELGASTTVVYRSPPESEDEAKALRLEFNGFCIPSFVEDGMLVAGATDAATSPGLLLLRANDALYAFANERYLRLFAKDPYRFLSPGLMAQVAARPPLVFLLGLHLYLPKEAYLLGARKVVRAGASGGGTATQSDRGAQTGQIDPYKDTHYVWNEWELRRLALQLAALRTKRTKSTQTQLSHMRRENETQVYLPKTQGTQTLLDAATQPPRVVRYVKGLRGTASSQLTVVEKVFQY